MAPTPGSRKPGRPRGSITLTDERRDQILTMLRGGASLKAAAETAGVPIRTLQGWIKSGSMKGTSRKVRAFAAEVARARGEARMSAEIRVHKDQPATWLRNTFAGQTADLDAEGDEDAPDGEQIKALAKKLRDLLLLTDPGELVPRCANSRCRCMFHRERTPDELRVLLALVERATSP